MVERHQEPIAMSASRLYLCPAVNDPSVAVQRQRQPCSRTLRCAKLK